MTPTVTCVNKQAYLRGMFVLDTSVLSPFARAKRLDTLRELLGASRVVTTAEVQAELRNDMKAHPELEVALRLPWCEVASPRDRLPFITLFADYYRVLGGDGRNIGEAAVMAYAKQEHGIAVLDDDVAVKLAREQQIEVIRSLRLIADAVRSKTLDVRDAETLVDELGRAGGRYPCTGSGLTTFLHQNDML